MTNKQKVLQFLETPRGRKRGIDNFNAMLELKIVQLQNVIYKLKEDGHQIKAVSNKNPNSKKPYKTYFLKEEDKQLVFSENTL